VHHVCWQKPLHLSSYEAGVVKLSMTQKLFFRVEEMKERRKRLILLSLKRVGVGQTRCEGDYEDKV
jgi:hypothetical protein